MLHQSATGNGAVNKSALNLAANSSAIHETGSVDEVRELLQRHYLHDLAELMIRLGQSAGKKNFLVSKHNKYINITTDSIAYFYVKHDTTIIVTSDTQEYFTNHSLEELQHLLPADQFFRVNRQYLVSFTAIKEVEHYFARKLLVNLHIPTKEKLFISKGKASVFLQWLDER